MTEPVNLIIRQGQSVSQLLPATGLETAGRKLVAHIRDAIASPNVICILSSDGPANKLLQFVDGGIQMTIGASVVAAWPVNAKRVEWVYDVHSYDEADVEDSITTHAGSAIVYGTPTRPDDVTPSELMPSGDARYTRFDAAQDLGPSGRIQAQLNILGEEYSPGGGGSGDVVGPASVTDSHVAAFDGTTGKLLKSGGYTIAGLLAAARDRATHTGTQLAATISDFASAVGALLTWAGISGKPSTFPGQWGDITGTLADQTDLAAALTAPVLGPGTRIELGGDMAFDLYYADATGLLARLETEAGKWLRADPSTGAPFWSVFSLSNLDQSAATTGQVATWNGSAWAPATPSSAAGGSSGQVQYNSGGALAGDAGLTYNDTTDTLSVSNIASTTGTNLAVSATAPSATTGASQAGKSAALSASAAVASTNTAGAAAGGDVTLTSGAAARFTSGNANGGNITLNAGAGIGTGTQGNVTLNGYQVIVPGGTASAPGIAFSGSPTYGINFSAFTMRFLYNTSAYIAISSGNVDFNSLTVTGNSATTSLSGFKRKTNTIAGGTASVTGVNSMALHSNSSATSLAIQNLPAASAGLEFEYYVLDADGIKLVALAGDDIRVIDKVTATGGYIQSTTIGSSVRLVAVDNTTWFALPIQGVWTDGTFTYDDTSLTTP